MSGLDGRVVIVTGGSRGVGQAILRRLAAEGAIVAINYRHDADSATEADQEITSAGGNAAAYPAAINDTDAVLTMVEAIPAELGRVSGVVSKAGTASKGRSIAKSCPAHSIPRLRPIHRVLQLLKPL